VSADTPCAFLEYNVYFKKTIMAKVSITGYTLEDLKVLEQDSHDIVIPYSIEYVLLQEFLNKGLVVQLPPDPNDRNDHNTPKYNRTVLTLANAPTNLRRDYKINRVSTSVAKSCYNGDNC